MRAGGSQTRRATAEVRGGGPAELGGDDYEFLRGTRRRWNVAGDLVRIVDLFAGCGGITLGAMEAAASLGRPARVALAAELDRVVAGVYRANFPDARVARDGDVTKLFDGALGARRTRAERGVDRRVGPVDLLVGGPPCQGHSNLNNHTRREDERNLLYLRMVRAAEVLEPSCIAIENVPSVVRDRHGVVEVARKRLERLGYEVDDGVVAVADLGVPQLRQRHLLMASVYGAPRIHAAVRAHSVPRRDLAWAIGDLDGLDSTDVFDTGASLSSENVRRARWLIDHDRFDLPNRLRPACHRFKPDHKYKSMYGRLRWSAPAQTITTGFGSPGQGRYIHPSQARTLTPHEAARLQFFPDWFTFAPAVHRAALAHCIGNAVPPKLGYAIARTLLSALSGRVLDGGAESYALVGS